MKANILFCRLEQLPFGLVSAKLFHLPTGLRSLCFRLQQNRQGTDPWRASRAVGDSSCFENLRHVRGNGLFEFARVSIERFEFLVQGFELFLEVLVAQHPIPCATRSMILHVVVMRR